MKPSLRFLGIAMLAWAGARATMLGMLPGLELFRLEAVRAKVPPIVPTEFAAVEPMTSSPPQQPDSNEAYPYVQALIRPVIAPVYYRTRLAEPPENARVEGAAALKRFAANGELDYWLLPRSAPASRPPRAATADRHSVPMAPVPPFEPKLDRVQLSSWALLRGQELGVAGSNPLASRGQLGSSQAGARLIYNLTRQFAIAARTSSEVGGRGGEVAAGARVQPLVFVPVWLSAERRQAIGQSGVRDAFAIFLEGGLNQQSLPERFSFDTYVQSGIVGLRSRDWFVDGAFAVSRPVYRNFSGGFGLWGGAQPGVSRIDFGPRLTMRVRGNLKVHLDWRQKLAGNARPGSGPALTLAGDF